MRICFAIVVLTLLSVLAGRSTVQAQSFGRSSSSPSTSGQMGMFGSRTLGSSFTPGRQSLFDANMSLGGQGDLSSARFVRGNRQPGQLVGLDAQAMQNPVGAAQLGAGPGGWSQPGGFNSSMTFQGGNYPGWMRNRGRDNQGGQKTAGQSTSSIRTSFHAAFDYPESTSEKLSTSLVRRLKKFQAQAPIQVEVRGRTAILRGVVTTEHDRVLAEQMARLEPGIEAVKNEVVVAGPMLRPSATP